PRPEFRLDVDGGLGATRRGKHRSGADAPLLAIPVAHHIHARGLPQVVAGRSSSLLDPSGAPGPSAQVVQLRPPHLTVPQHLDLVDAWAVDRERALDTDAVGRDPAHREVLVDAAAPSPDDDALERLNALAVTFDDLDVDPHRVTRPKVRDVIPQVLLLDTPDYVHHRCATPTLRRGPPVA